MKSLIVAIFTAITFLLPSSFYAQSDFSVLKYAEFLESNRNLTANVLMSRHAPVNIYYESIEGGTQLEEFSYLDSVAIKYDLTGPEINQLKKNHFVVTERLSFKSFGEALHDIYNNDLPVFVTTDAILHALHASYDKVLMDIELKILIPNLSSFLDALYDSFPQLISKYDSNENMHAALGDIDLYITMAKSLLEDKKLSPQYINSNEVDALWEAVQSEQFVMMPLFSERNRRLDFSQFTVRGHYTDELYYQLKHHR